MKLLTKAASCFFLAVPIFVFFGFYFNYALNCPINDDYALLSFMNNYLSTDSILEKTKLLFAQHNEHRIVYDRIWTLLTYKINGQINFKFLSLIGMLSLIGIAYVFYRKFVYLNKNILLFFPVTVLIFNLTSWENIMYPMAALSNFTVYLFMILSLYYITLDTKDSKRHLYFSILFFVLGIFTQGGGLFLYPICLMILLYKREFKNFGIFFGISTLFILLYFYDYHNYGQSKPIIESIVEYKTLIIQFSSSFVANAFNFYRLFTNNTQQSVVMTSMLGAVFMTIFIYMTFKKYYNKNLFIYSVLLLIIISSGITAVSRLYLGIETAGASRYRINGIIFAVALYFWFVENHVSNRTIYFLPIITASTVYFYYFNLKQYEYLQIYQKDIAIGALAYNSNDSNFLFIDKNFVETNLEDLKKAKKNGVYKFPSNDYFKHIFPISKEASVQSNFNQTPLTNTILPARYSIDRKIKLESDFLINGWAFIEFLDTNNQEIYVGLKNKSDEGIKYFSTNQSKKFDLNPYFKKDNLEDGGYSARIKFSDIKEGDNQILLLIRSEGKFIVKETDQFINKN